jgi:hypothetical protein
MAAVRIPVQCDARVHAAPHNGAVSGSATSGLRRAGVTAQSQRGLLGVSAVRSGSGGVHA